MAVRHILEVDIAVRSLDGAAEFLADLDRSDFFTSHQVDPIYIAVQGAGDQHFFFTLLDQGLAVAAARFLDFLKAHARNDAFHLGAGLGKYDALGVRIGRWFHGAQIDDGKMAAMTGNIGDCIEGGYRLRIDYLNGIGCTGKGAKNQGCHGGCCD